MTEIANLPKLEQLTEKVIKEPTIEILDDYLYAYNLALQDFHTMRIKYIASKANHEEAYELKVKSLMEIKDEKGKSMSKTAAETIAKTEMSDTVKELKVTKITVESVDQVLKLKMTIYHHAKSKMKGDLEMDKEA
tara:strand:- start:741 stop:1145 length:405 start_codon:yes stop_codon:yes gene_type:complete